MDEPTPDLLGELLARCAFPPAGTNVTCAVSGGADSLALLALARAAGLEVVAVHVDHGLRPGSAAEADPVRVVAEGLGAGFRTIRVDVSQGPNLEARARRARYAALPPGVLTGHTADDQAETVVVNLLRGAGLDGLAGMRQGQDSDSVQRPLLALRRAETRALCAELGLRPMEDPSNLDARFVRNRIRNEVLPLLADVAGRDPVPVLVRQAEVLATEAALLDELAGAIDATESKALAGAHPVLARRAIRNWLREASGNPERHPPSAAEVARILAVARGQVVACQLSGGRRIRRSAGRLYLTAGDVSPTLDDADLDWPDGPQSQPAGRGAGGAQ